MIIRLIIIILVIALAFYYLLILLEIFSLIKLNHSEDERISWFPFYYLFKKAKKQDVKRRKNSNIKKNNRHD
jgi:hypothetical protein